MKHTSFLYLALVLPLFAVITGCRSVEQQIADYEQNLTLGRYHDSAATPLVNAQKHDNSELMWQLFGGAGELYANENSESIITFDRAEDIFLRNDRKSVFSQAADASASILVNDRVVDYNGGGQDRIFCCFYKALAYASMKDFQAARTELNRAEQHQENWLFERKKDIIAAEDSLKKQISENEKKQQAQAYDQNATVTAVLGNKAFTNSIAAQCHFDPATSGDPARLAPKDYTNAYICHFCGVFRWLNHDGGRNYLRDAADLTPGHPLLQQDFKDCDANVIPQNQVWIYVEDGLCPKRVEWRVDLPLFFMPEINRFVQYAGMALPYLIYRSAAADSYTLQFNGQQYPIALLEDQDRLFKTEYDVYMRGALTREILRTISKATIQGTLGILAEHSNDSNHRLALRLSQTAAAVYARATTMADVRSWTALPKRIYMARITLPSDGVISLAANFQNYPSQLMTITLSPGNHIVWVRKPAMTANPAIKIISF